MLILCLGGARSGKSAFALELAHDHERRVADGATGVTFIATSPRIGGDDDLAARIAAHRAERPATWRTIEEPHDLQAALIASDDAFVIVDCLTLWVSNLLWRGDDGGAIVRTAADTAGLAARRSATTVAISNEVGMGVHPATADGRHYRDLLGRVNQVWAAAADRSLLLVAGRALPLHDPRSLL